MDSQLGYKVLGPILRECLVVSFKVFCRDLLGFLFFCLIDVGEVRFLRGGFLKAYQIG